jgi:hypothetical protein
MLTFHLPLVAILLLVAGTVLPLLVGLVTTRVTAPGIKSILLAALALVATVLGQVIVALQTGEPFDVGAALLLALVTFLIAVGMHYGLWKPVGVAAALADTLVKAPVNAVVTPAAGPGAATVTVDASGLQTLNPPTGN